MDKLMNVVDRSFQTMFRAVDILEEQTKILESLPESSVTSSLVLYETNAGDLLDGLVAQLNQFCEQIMGWKARRDQIPLAKKDAIRAKYCQPI